MTAFNIQSRARSANGLLRHLAMNCAVPHELTRERRQCAVDLPDCGKEGFHREGTTAFIEEQVKRATQASARSTHEVMTRAFTRPVAVAGAFGAVIHARGASIDAERVAQMQERIKDWIKPRGGSLFI